MGATSSSPTIPPSSRNGYSSCSGTTAAAAASPRPAGVWSPRSTPGTRLRVASARSVRAWWRSRVAWRQGRAGGRRRVSAGLHEGSSGKDCSMRVSVFGLGYVGAVSCGCLSRDGLEVIGVDVNPDKVGMINAGKSPIVEEQVGDLIATAVAAGRLRATTDTAEAVRSSEVSVISVGTPSRPNGAVDFAALTRVCEAIGHTLRDKPGRHLLVVRSTVLPGTVRSLVVPHLEK